MAGVWGNMATGDFNYEPTVLGLGATMNGTGGTFNSLKVQKTMGTVFQSFLVKEGIVATLGVRHDDVHSNSN